MTETLSHDLPAIAHDSSPSSDDVFILPASFAQKRLWFLEQWEPGVYHIPTAVGMKGTMNAVAMERSIQEIIRRHEVLRTTFRLADGDIVQVVAPHMPFTMSIVDLRSFSPDVRNVKERRLVAENFHRPFDLSNGPLFRVTLLCLRDDAYSLLLTMHHIVSDAWSMEVFVHELTTLYAAYVSDKPSPLPALPIQYADYAIWQHDWLRGEILEEHLSYWKEQLADVPVLQLPTDRPRPAIQSFRGAARILMFPKELSADLKQLCRREGVTLFMLLLSAFKVLLYRYSKQDTIIVGIPIAGRTDSRLENLIGCLINTLALHTDLSGNPTFHELLGRVREVSLSAYSHQDLPFERLVEEMQLERDLSYNPLTQVMFALQNVPRGEVSLPGLVLSPLKLDSETSKLKNVDAERMSRKQNSSSHGKKNAMFDLDLTMWENNENLFGELKYNTDLFDAQTMNRLYEHFQHLLQAIANDPTLHIDDISLLSESERQQIVDLNATETDNPLDRSFQELFEKQVERTPNAVAVKDEQQELTYRELNEQANRLAHQLVEIGVGPESLVALLAERGIPLLTAILAIFKAGGAYLPLDPLHPESRLIYILQHSDSRLLLAQKSGSVVLAETVTTRCQEIGVRVEYLEELGTTGHSTQNLVPRNNPRSLAYVIYTSGSTGAPKGVMIEQRGMINHLYAKIHALDLQEDDCIAQTASQCFDISVWQHLAALLLGGRVQIYPDTVAHDPVALLQQVNEHEVSILEIVPSFLRVLLEIYQDTQDTTESRPTLDALRWLIPTGEALPAQLCRKWLELYPEIPLLNAYGPTECSDDVAHYVIAEPPPETLASVPIGSPVDNTQLYVLDTQMKLAPIGIAGELYVGGVGVGRGYLKDAERTAAAFVHNPFSNEERLYRTGDGARYLADGTLEFLGRLDYQVKIRGFRIELAEIEAIFNRHPTVLDSVVIVHDDANGNQRLIAYCVLHNGQKIEAEDLLQFAKTFLPDYMVPAYLLLLEAFPLTANGKLDRKALPLPDQSSETHGSSYVRPRTALEQSLVEIWTDVLGVEHIGIQDDFFTLGGHSLLTVRLLAIIQKKLGQRLPLATIFQYRTIEQLAEILQNHKAASPWLLQAQGDQAPEALRADAILDLETCPEVWPGKIELKPARIMLTGATGFLGTFLLAELLKKTSADIYCLVRATDQEQARKKLRELLQEIELWQPEFEARIIPVPGDLAQPRLGLSELTYQEMLENLDTIYHNGALVNSMYPYQDLRAANVLGTKEIIHLASHGRVKPLHYVSTLSVFTHTPTAWKQVIREQETLDEHCELIKGGYAQSKWVAEKLVTSARSRGLPVSIYRPGRITGHSQTGSWRTEDILCRVIQGCVQMGCVPMISAEDTVEMTPVDYVSQAIVELSQHKSSFGQVYHLLNMAPAKVNDIVHWLNTYGYPVQLIDHSEWLQKMKQAQEKDLDNPILPIMPLVFSQEPIKDSATHKQIPPMIFDNRNAVLGLSSTGLTCPPDDEHLLHTYLQYLVRQGSLMAPRAK